MRFNYGYIRTSTNDQASGANMQENSILELALKQGEKIDKIYKDEAVSGGNANRIGFNFLKEQIKISRSKYPTAEIFVYIYDNSRIARDMIIGEEFIQMCWRLDTLVIDRSGSIQDYSTWESRTFARVGFAISTADKEKKNDDAMRGMKNAMRSGRYIFRPKPGQIKGYRFQKVDKVKVLVKCEPEASIVKQVLEDYAAGIIKNPTHAKTCLENQGVECSQHVVYIKNMLLDPLYAGYIEYLEWGIPLTKAIHEPIISWETHQLILERFGNKKQTNYSARKNDDFPLRGIVACSHCEKLMQAYATTNRHGTEYKYYECRNRQCTEYRKPTNSDMVENAVLELLKNLKPDEWLLETARMTFDLYWENRILTSENTLKIAKKELGKINQDINRYLDRILSSNSKTVVEKFESEIERLESEKISLSEKIANIGGQNELDLTQSRTLTERVLKMLKNLDTFWEKGSIATKQAITNLVFEGRFYWDRDLKGRTLQKSDIFGFFSTLQPE